MGQINYVISLALIGLFTVAIIAFGVAFASDNNSYVSLSDDSEITSLKTKTEGNLSEFRTKSESSYSSIVNSSIEQGETIKSGGVFSLTITDIVKVPVNIANVGYKKIFGSDGNFSIFITAFIAIIGFLGFMYFVKTWLGRNPD